MQGDAACPPTPGVLWGLVFPCPASPQHHLLQLRAPSGSAGMGAPRRVLLARGSSACAWGLGAEGWGLGAGSWSLDPTLGPFPCPNLQAGLWASPCAGAAGCERPQRRQEAAPEPSRRGRGVGCHFINHQAPFKDGVLTFPAPAWGFISSFISCSNNSSRSPGAGGAAPLPAVPCPWVRPFPAHGVHPALGWGSWGQPPDPPQLHVGVPLPHFWLCGVMPISTMSPTCPLQGLWL